MIPLLLGDGGGPFFRAGFMDFSEEPTSFIVGASSTNTSGSFWDILNSCKMHFRDLLTQGRRNKARFVPLGINS